MSLTLQQVREDWDWQAAFEYAGPTIKDGGYANGSPDIRSVPGDDVSREPFSLYSVRRLFAASPGENDGPEWLAFGELYDGRLFVLEAGCDYTGWDCQAGGSATVMSDRKFVQQAATADQWARLAAAPCDPAEAPHPADDLIERADA